MPATLTAPQSQFVPADEDHRYRFTREQYYRMGELGIFGNRRVERLRGEIYEMSPVNWPHVVACRKTAILLERVFAGIGWVSRNEQPISLDDSDPEPDVMVIAGRFEDYSDHPTTALLIVEVAHSSLLKDKTLKADVYAESSIAEYWILDLVHRVLIVHHDPTPRPDGGGEYRTILTLSPAESVSPLAAPTASILVSDLLP